MAPFSAITSAATCRLCSVLSVATMKLIGPKRSSAKTSRWLASTLSSNGVRTRACGYCGCTRTWLSSTISPSPRQASTRSEVALDWIAPSMPQARSLSPSKPSTA
ncbi:hypothetical protein D3C81_1666250 [compost metagenome]